jgi:hypothetical protein
LRTVIYTAIYGNKDELQQPSCEIEDVDFICFTDNPDLKGGRWKVVEYPPFHKKSSVLSAKYFKIVPHEVLPDYDFSCWIDGNLIVKGDLLKGARESMREEEISFALLSHPEAINCLYHEIERCIDRKKDSHRRLAGQRAKYRLEKHPANTGLWACHVLFRLHRNPAVMKFSREWWRHIQKYSIRDQISFARLAYLRNFRFKVFGRRIYDNNLEYVDHNDWEDSHVSAKMIDQLKAGKKINAERGISRRKKKGKKYYENDSNKKAL